MLTVETSRWAQYGPRIGFEESGQDSIQAAMERVRAACVSACALTGVIHLCGIVWGLRFTTKRPSMCLTRHIGRADCLEGARRHGTAKKISDKIDPNILPWR